MNITINPISQIKTNFTQKNNINFERGHLKLVKPNYKTSFLQKLNDKITNILKTFPNMASMETPLPIQIEDKLLTIAIDKTRDFGSRVKIAMKEKENEFLELDINNKGQVIRGLYNSSDDNILGMLFTRNEKNVRRILYGNCFYMPSTEYDNVWTRLQIKPQDFKFYSTCQNMTFRNTELQEFLIELAKKDTAFLIHNKNS